MKYFLDTEFIEDGRTIDLISIALACEDGRSLYRQNVGASFGSGSDWLWRNVYLHLGHFSLRGVRSCSPAEKDGPLGTKANWCASSKENPCPWRDRAEIRDEVLAFCDQGKYGKPEFWGYFADYDWVAFCQLFGTMMQLPKGYPMYCRDLKQWADQLGNVRIPKPEVEIHHALADALWCKEAYEFLFKQPCPPGGFK
jgi:hypothetical protein